MFIIPVNERELHWACLVIFFPDEGPHSAYRVHTKGGAPAPRPKVFCMDSFYTRESPMMRWLPKATKLFLQAFQWHALRNGAIDCGASEPEVIYVPCTHQATNNCGYHTVANILALIRVSWKISPSILEDAHRAAAALEL